MNPTRLVRTAAVSLAAAATAVLGLLSAVPTQAAVPRHTIVVPSATRPLPSPPGVRTADDVTGFHTVSSGTWSNSPSASDLSGYAFGNNNPIGLQCWEYGGPAGPYSNTLWYWAQDTANNTYGWISDHNLTTPGTATHPQPQGGECATAEKL